MIRVSTEIFTTDEITLFVAQQDAPHPSVTMKETMMIRPILILCLPYIVGCTSPTVADSPGVDDTFAPNHQPTIRRTTDDSGGGAQIKVSP